MLVWVHGGAYVLGSGSQPYYNGRRLAADGDVVVVAPGPVEAEDEVVPSALPPLPRNRQQPPLPTNNASSP